MLWREGLPPSARPAAVEARQRAMPPPLVVPVATAATAGVTLVKNPVAGAGGYRTVVTGAGEPHIVRTELGVVARTPAGRRWR